MTISSTNEISSFNEDFIFKISKGLVQGHSLQYIHSYNPAVDTSQSLIWPLSGVITFNDTPTTLYLTSSNAADTQFVTINWLDGDYNQQTSSVQLTGQTPVAIGVGLRVNRAFTTDTSATLGDVYISNALSHTLGVPTQETTVAMYEASTQTRSMALYTVPAGHTAFGLSGYFSTPKTRDNDFFWNVRNPPLLLPPINTNVVSVSESTVEIDFKYTSIPEKTDAYFTANTTAGSGRVSMRIPLVLVDNEFLNINKINTLL